MKLIKMKRIAILLILAMAIFEPKEPVKPIEPIEVKPALATAIKEPWMMGKHIMGYYQHINMPDGTRPQLKSKVPLDEKGWLALADKQWDAMKQEELNQPKICPYCGGPMP